MSVYVGKQVQVSITKTTEGDMGSFIAQEVTFEPKQSIEGIDDLGHDEIQAWATGLKTYEGTIKEAFKVGADGKKQLDRTPPFQTALEEYTAKLIWDGGTDNKITVTLTGVIFPEPSVASPKNAPAYVTTKFRAKSASIAIA
jgi:predicted RecA/RadA family phage recombinase